MANNLMQWDPFAGRSNLHNQLDDIFNNFFSAPALPLRNAAALDVYTEDDKQLVAEAQLPGFSKDDVEININNDVLEIKGEKHDKEEAGKEGKRNYMVRESHASFYRSIALPKHADADKVKGAFKDGVLKVTVPFKELPKPKKVAIEAK